MTDTRTIFIGELINKHYFIEYINSILENYKDASVIWINSYDEILNLKLKNKFIIHIQHLFYPIENDYENIHIVLNTESIRHNNFLIKILKKYPTIDVIDHSIANITEILKKKTVNHIYHIPYQINLKEISNVPKTKDIIMQTNNTNRRRIHGISIANRLGEYLKNPISFIEGWGEKRDSNIFNHKILISINSYDNMSQISCFRTDRCVFNKMIVIQEIPDEDIENLSSFVHPELQNMMIFEKLSNIYDRTIDVYENYDKYYQQLFGNVDFEELGHKLRLKINNAITTIENRHISTKII